MQDRISCREGVYKGWKNAVEYLPKAGIAYIELEERPAAELRQVADACRAAGVTPLTISGGVDACNPEAVARVKAMCEAAEQIGVKHYFLSAHGKDRPAAMKALAQIGEHAAKHGVTLCLETHPPFCANADGMLQTMAEVNHTNVQINFDTANVLFYNHGLNSAEELATALPKVASLHLKDTRGGFHSADFPVLGKGVVEFRRVFDTLHRVKFTGPLTIELEGAVVDGLDVPSRHQKVVESMNHLRQFAL